jgi:hypothetical protein
MGLGKTLQSIALLLWLVTERKQKGPFCIFTVPLPFRTFFSLSLYARLG